MRVFTKEKINPFFGPKNLMRHFLMQWFIYKKIASISKSHRHDYGPVTSPHRHHLPIHSHKLSLKYIRIPFLSAESEFIFTQ